MLFKWDIIFYYARIYPKYGSKTVIIDHFRVIYRQL